MKNSILDVLTHYWIEHLNVNTLTFVFCFSCVVLAGTRVECWLWHKNDHHPSYSVYPCLFLTQHPPS